MFDVSNLKNCSLPSYDKSQLKAGILHIGIGAFHRAHQVCYIDKLLNLGDKEALKWGYISGTIRTNQKLINDLKENDCQYILSANSESGTTNSVIGALKDVYFAGEGHSDELIKYIATSDIKIITYTVTEKGYFVDLSTQKLNLLDDEIIYDIENFNSPKTAIGITVAGLHARKQQNAGAITLLSCDNMPNNGAILKQAILDFAYKIDKELATWIEKNCTFPSSMVDRIVPAVTDETLENIEKLVGMRDKSAISTEEFSQWVIEDDFANGRPSLEKVGVEFVKDIEPFEKLKLTMLNGSHSLIAYLGAYAGLKTVDDVITNKGFYNFIKKYMLEIAAPLVDGLPKEVSTTDYADKLLHRFANPHLKHRTEQIAMDGSKKVPQRWLGSLEYLLDNNRNYDILAIGLAGWILFCGGRDENDNLLQVSDPLQEKYQGIYAQNSSTKDIVKGFLAIDSIFTEKLIKDSNLVDKVEFFIIEIKNNGVIKTLSKVGE
ncbi:mannitol dehydrogenase family protein [Francisella sp. Scap27]|uniref:mannitol dehydrogenase family protein n=1 Tax=Francisella sp. Scap27 TaxID=2589986 RepID=UPI0015C1C410|nr:mannitol dehydrogenase family protein [Francisella sp. Scap27]QLE78926.1 mannitol dehydrogenase family protein [Francisella sp. Scap27]